jgi:hypothetical protein
MTDRITEPFNPGEPEPTYDWDFEEGTPRGRPKVLWGRVVALSLVLIFAFWLGRASAPDGVNQSEIDRLEAELADANEEIDGLRAELQTQPEPETSPTAESTPDDGAAAEGDTYVVERGDTLRGVAERFYDDASLAECIQEANGIDDAGQLSVGMELTVPPEEECA